jgi:hypothetical protein
MTVKVDFGTPNTTQADATGDTDKIWKIEDMITLLEENEGIN